MELPPRSIEPEGLFDGLKPGAILIGAVVDHVATAIAFSALVAWLGPADAISGDEEARRSAIDGLLSQPEFLLWSLAVGLCCTVLGAYVGATRAGALRVRHGGWIAVASAALGLAAALLSGQSPSQAPPLWHEALGWGLLLPAGLLGGLLSEKLHAARD